MPLFICEKCGTIENTATGHYWARDVVKFKDHPELDGKALCSACTPEFFEDGSPTGMGKWHNRFPRNFVSELTEKQIREYQFCNINKIDVNKFRKC